VHLLLSSVLNEIYQVPTCARDTKMLGDIRGVTDVIPEDDRPLYGKNKYILVLNCAWVEFNQMCSRLERLKTHAFTYIGFKPSPETKFCGDSTW